MKPLILVSAGLQSTARNMDEFHLYKNYIDPIVHCGGIPIITCSENACELAEITDGLYLTGGEDLAPALYGQEKSPLCGEIDDIRDEIEMQLLKEFEKKRKPVFGICRGIQTMNIYFGGTLIQDLPSQRGITDQSHTMHMVTAEQNSCLREFYGETFLINSYHHQAIDLLGKRLRVEAWYNDTDSRYRFPEAISHEELPFFAVQWHPERMVGEQRYDTEGPSMLPLFQQFVDWCRPE